MWGGGRLRMVLRKLLRFRVFSRGEGERGKVCFTKLQMNGTSNTSLSSIHWGRGKLHIELRKLLRFRVFNRVGGGKCVLPYNKRTKLQKLLRFRVFWGGGGTYRTSKTSSISSIHPRGGGGEGVFYIDKITSTTSSISSVR